MNKKIFIKIVLIILIILNIFMIFNKTNELKRLTDYDKHSQRRIGSSYINPPSERVESYDKQLKGWMIYLVSLNIFCIIAIILKKEKKYIFIIFAITILATIFTPIYHRKYTYVASDFTHDYYVTTYFNYNEKTYTRNSE